VEHDEWHNEKVKRQQVLIADKGHERNESEYKKVDNLNEPREHLLGAHKKRVVSGPSF
jgi:hypothetical protein